MPFKAIAKNGGAGGYRLLLLPLGNVLLRTTLAGQAKKIQTAFWQFSPSRALAPQTPTTKKPHSLVGCFRGGAGGYRPRVQWLTLQMHYKLVLFKIL